MNMLAAIAEFEAELTRERVKAGIEHAQRVGTRSGNPHGRPVRVFRRDEAIRLRESGMSYREISRVLKIPDTTVRRACAKNQPSEIAPSDGIRTVSGSL